MANKNKKEVLVTFLSELEKEALGQFYSNAVMREAVKKVLLFDIYNNGVLKKGESPDPTRNFSLQLAFLNRNPESGVAVANEQLGADLRAVTEGLCLVENAWAQISGFLPEGKKEEKPKGNRAV